MKRIIASIAAATLLLLSVPASADVAQTWQCKLAEGKTFDDVMALSEAWLALAKEVDENTSVRIYVPVAGSADSGSFVWVAYMPNFASWGKAEDAYDGSPLAGLDTDWNTTAPCEKVSHLYATVDLE